MGFGDQLLAAGQAKLLHRKTGKKIAIGRPRDKVYWSAFYEHNPYLVRNPKGDFVWLENYPGHRGYFLRKDSEKWYWNYDYRAEPAEIFWGKDEVVTPGDYVVVEPHTKGGASPAKKWPYYQAVVDLMRDVEFRQPDYGLPILRNVKPIKTTLRQAALLIAGARAVLLPDGCLQHVSAAVGTPGVVIFGGFAPKEVLGYPIHTTLGDGAYGYREDCEASRDAMEKIRPETVAGALRAVIDSRKR